MLWARALCRFCLATAGVDEAGGCDGDGADDGERNTAENEAGRDDGDASDERWGFAIEAPNGDHAGADNTPEDVEEDVTHFC